MSIAAASVAAANLLQPSIPTALLKRFSLEEYHSMIAAGVFAEDKNFELLEGLIVRKITIHPDHWIATGFLRDALQSLGISGCFVHSQEPVTTQDSEPEPHVALIKGNRRDYRAGNPDPNQVILVVEVADSSLAEDRRWKKRIYARAGISVYWIVNVIDRQIEIYTQPSGPNGEPDYKQCQIVGSDGELPVVIDGREVGRIKVKDVLP